MAVITLTITPSTTETTPGIPNTVSVSTSEPANIFYTLDGTSPNLYSAVYTCPIQLNSVMPVTVLSLFATNGTDNSAVIVETYTADLSQVVTDRNERLPHSTITPFGGGNQNSNYPFGNNTPSPNFQYQNPSNAGYTVYNQALPTFSNGFNADGYAGAFTNRPLSAYQFKQVYSDSNYEGEVFPGVGNFPARVVTIGKSFPEEYNPEVSSTASKIFNPRALVIYQDAATEDPTNPVIINRANFNLENPEIVRDGDLLYNAGGGTEVTNGSFLKSYYNPRTHTMTSYYYDNSVNRWIISTSPFTPTNPNIGNLSYMVPARNSFRVYQWHLFYNRILG